MKKVLITGGAGTVGQAFIQRYPDYQYFSISRNEKHAADLLRNYPNVGNFIADIRGLEHITTLFNTVKPDVVIHAAAMKHVNLAEENPTSAVTSNILGSLNVIRASITAYVPITLGISTDKACCPDNVYGYTKRMMEQLFFEHNTTKNKFVCTRFANVANSNGSVIPFFKKCKAENKPILLTDKNMNRLMFSKQESAELIHKAITEAEKSDMSFILSKLMKNVNMLDLANIFSDDIKIVGKRPGEKLNETLVSKKEIPFTLVTGDGYVFIEPEETPETYRLEEELSSLSADNMTNDELEDLIWTEK